MNVTPSLLALRLFMRVAELRNFSAAAAEFNLPPSSVTRHITKLEQQLQHPLFFRHPRSVRLTQAGAKYYDTIYAAIQVLDQAAEEIASSETVSGTLRLNAPPAFARLHLAPLVHAFQQTHASVDVEVWLADTFLDPIDGGFDISIRIGELPDSTLIARPLAEQRFVMCASQRYLDSHAPIQTPEDLSQHNCLLYQAPRGLQKWHVRRDPQQSFEVLELGGNLNSNHAEYLLATAIQGQGVVLFATWLVAHHLASGDLVQVLPDHEWAIDPHALVIHAVYPSVRRHSLKTHTFLDYLQEKIGTPAYWDLSFA